MPHFICTTCGMQYAESSEPPARCDVCEDERQYVKPSGQGWTTSDKLRRMNRNSLRALEPGLIGIGVEPQFAIGQRALLVRTSNGNILWDCVPLLDEAIVDAVRAWGGLQAIAISHPHYYSNMVEWSMAFGDVPIYIHADDRQWAKRPDTRIEFWTDETKSLADGITVIRCGGHFAGGAVLHWAAGSEGRGALLSGDIIQVVPDRKHVSFMYSYPNYVPLNARAVERIVKAVEPYPFDRIYGAFWDMVIESEGHAVVQRSAQRFLDAIRP